MLDAMLLHRPIATVIRSLLGWNYSTNKSTGTKAISNLNGDSGRQFIDASIQWNGYTYIWNGYQVPALYNLSGMTAIGQTDFTVDIVVRLNTSTSSLTKLFELSGTTADTITVAVGDAGSSNRFIFFVGTSKYVISLTRTAANARWVRITLQRRGGVITVYVDGSKTGVAAGNGNDYAVDGVANTTSLPIFNRCTILQEKGYVLVAEFAYTPAALYTANFAPKYPLV